MRGYETTTARATYGVKSPVTYDDVKRMRAALESGEAVGYFTRRIIEADLREEA